MADWPTTNDDATRYVLGELNAAERHAFEARLKQSAELRAHVRELEEGLEAAAITSPPHQPSPELWQRIQRAVADESREEVVVAPEFRPAWIAYAWAAAACLVGGLLLGLWLMRLPSGKSPAHAGVKNLATGSQKEGTQVSTKHGTLVLHQTAESPPISITNQAADAQPKPAMDSASHALRFFSGAASSNATTGSPMPTPSPDLQRALFVAMSRDLGWQSGGDANTDEGVDVVDLRPAGAALAQPPPMVMATGSLVGFVSGDSLYLAFGSNVVPRAQELQFWAGAEEDDAQLLGTATLDDNPLVIVIPSSVVVPGGGTLSVIGVSPSGASNFVGQIFIFAPAP